MASSLFLLQAGCFHTHGGSKRKTAPQHPAPAVRHVVNAKQGKRALLPVQGVGMVVISTFRVQDDPEDSQATGH